VFDSRTHHHGRIDLAQAQAAGGLGDDSALNAAMIKSQSSSGSPWEMFGDMFLNWVMGSFADTEGGAATEAWMDEHMSGDASAEDWRDRGWIDLASQPREERWLHGTIEHVIAPDDNLTTLANYYGVTEDEIRAANPGLRTLIVGNKIKIPGNIPDEAVTSDADPAPVFDHEGPTE
jgi:hypothetical protein